MILASIFVCLSLVSAFNYLRTRRQSQFVVNLKGPVAWPLIGAMHKIALLSPTNFFERSAFYLAKYGSLTRVWVFHRLFILVADLELAKQLLLSESHLATGQALMSDWLADSVLMCQPEQWPQRHQLLMSLSQPHNLLHLTQLLRQHGQQLCQELAEQAKARRVFDIWPLVSSNVLQLMLAINCGTQPTDQYKQAIIELSELYRNRFLSIKSVNRLAFSLASPLTRWRQQRLIGSINAENQQLLEERRVQQLNGAQAKVEGITIDRIEPAPSREYQSLLDLLLSSGQLSDGQRCAELNACNFLGHLLCSSALCFALVQIARHPAVQQRCLEELRAAGSDKERALPYLEAVLRETLRLHPPQLIVSRELGQDFQYTHSQVGEGTLPAGAEIYINLYELQRAEPQLFQPERFLEPPQSPQLLSFGLGPRRCPAEQLSLCLLRELVAPLLLQYELLPHGDALRPSLRWALGSWNGFQMALQPRQ